MPVSEQICLCHDDYGSRSIISVGKEAEPQKTKTPLISVRGDLSKRPTEALQEDSNKQGRVNGRKMEERHCVERVLRWCREPCCQANVPFEE